MLQHALGRMGCVLADRHGRRLMHRESIARNGVLSGPLGRYGTGSL